MNKKRITLALIVMTLIMTLFTLPANAAKISQKKATLVVGQTLKLKIKKASGKVKWSSTKKSVASVSSKGVITAKKIGKATIKAKVGRKTFKCNITVKANVYISKDDSYADPLLNGVTVAIKIYKLQYTSPNTLVATIKFQPLDGYIVVSDISLKMFKNGTAFFNEYVYLTTSFFVDSGNVHTLTMTLKKKDFPSMRFIDLTKLTDDEFDYVVGW